MEKITNLHLTTKANDVDKKGRVTVAVNGIGIEDSQHDISMPGSFDNTLKTNLPRMKWLKDHDYTKLLGIPLEGAEKDGNLVMVGQLNMEKEMCRDVYADYKLAAEYGRTLEHSIGVRAIKRDKEDRRKVLEWEMWEYSTLAFLGANPQTFLIDIKSATRSQVKDAVELLTKALDQPEYSEYKLKKLDMNLSLMLKKLAGGNIVVCPECGEAFDWDACQPHTISQEVMECAYRFIGWIAEDTVYQHIQTLKPEIQAEVLGLLDTMGLGGMKSKSITDVLTYVRCPHCWARVYETALAMLPDDTAKSKADDKEDEEEEKPESDSEETTESSEETESTEEETNDDDKEEDEEEKSFSSMLKNIVNKSK